jgi:hypothetical protein
MNYRIIYGHMSQEKMRDCDLRIDTERDGQAKCELNQGEWGHMGTYPQVNMWN